MKIIPEFFDSSGNFKINSFYTSGKLEDFFSLPLFLVKPIDNVGTESHAHWNPAWLKKQFAVMLYMFPLCWFGAETHVDEGGILFNDTLMKKQW